MSTNPEETEVKDHLVWSYEHKAWWGPNHCGYTPIILDAGLYTHAEATEICESANYAPEIKHEEARTLRAALVRFQAKNSVGALLWNALYAPPTRTITFAPTGYPCSPRCKEPSMYALRYETVKNGKRIIRTSRMCQRHGQRYAEKYEVSLPPETGS